MTPFPLIDRGSSNPVNVEVQVPGSGYFMEATAFVSLLNENKFIEKLCVGYSRVLLLQTASTVGSMMRHTIEERLARWLLMCHDRISGDQILLTHSSLAAMLGVRRASVTTALHVLEGHGLIRSTRGLVTMRNRSGAERFAGDSYGMAERAYELLVTFEP